MWEIVNEIWKWMAVGTAFAFSVILLAVGMYIILIILVESIREEVKDLRDLQKERKELRQRKKDLRI